MVNRRRLLAGAAAGSGLAILGRFRPHARALSLSPGGVPTPVAPRFENGVSCFDLKAMQLSWPLLDNAPLTPIWSYSPTLLPLLKAKRGEPIRVRLLNM